MVLCGSETWSLTLREEHIFGVYENRVLSRISEPKRNEVTGRWRKQHDEELRNLSSSPIKIIMIKSRSMRSVEHVARKGEERNAYRLLVGKPEGKRLLRRPGSWWVDNIMMDIGEKGWGY
jgi:hypothetical protein